MKKLLLLLFSISSIHTAHAADLPQLHIRLSGNVPNTYYICVSNAGCLNARAGMAGHSFPLSPGEIGHIFLANGSNYRMYPQALPKVCQVELTNNQTLTVRGQVISRKGQATIQGLSCSIS